MKNLRMKAARAAMDMSQQQLADLVLVESRSHGPFPRIDVTQADTGTLVDDILFLTGYRSSAI